MRGVLERDKLSDCLVNGSFGILEAMRIIENSKLYQGKKFDYISYIINKKKSRDWKTFIPNHNQISLIRGLAGIGYSLIRHANWQHTPSILYLKTEPNLIFN